MKISQVAAQLYTTREFQKTPEGVAESLKKVREIGYEAVQVSGVSADIAPAEVKAICDDLGLVICATHEPSNVILETPEKVVETLKGFGTKYTAYPYPGGIDFTSEESVAGLIAKLENAAQVLAAAGQVLTYHNHQIEFLKLDGKILLDRIYDEAPTLQGEIDTYWIQYGGGDPIAWAKKLAGRMPLIHLKDFGITPERTINFCEIGNGVLDMPGICAAAEAGGCEWFIVEQDKTPGDPYDSLTISFNYIRDNIAE